MIPGIFSRRRISEWYGHRRRWLVGLTLGWFLFINFAFYLGVLRKEAPGLFDFPGLEWLR